MYRQNADEARHKNGSSEDEQQHKTPWYRHSRNSNNKNRDYWTNEDFSRNLDIQNHDQYSARRQYNYERPHSRWDYTNRLRNYDQYDPSEYHDPHYSHHGSSQNSAWLDGNANNPGRKYPHNYRKYR